MRHDHIIIRARFSPFQKAGLFFFVLCLAVFPAATSSFGEGCTGSAKSGLPSAYTWTPETAYSAGMVGEDPTWARYAARGQAFENCPKITPLPEAGYLEPPVQKRRASKKKSTKRAVQKQPAPQPVPKQAATSANPCPPIIMPVPALPICPDSAPGSKR